MIRPLLVWTPGGLYNVNFRCISRLSTRHHSNQSIISLENGEVQRLSGWHSYNIQEGSAARCHHIQGNLINSTLYIFIQLITYSTRRVATFQKDQGVGRSDKNPGTEGSAHARLINVHISANWWCFQYACQLLSRPSL